MNYTTENVVDELQKLISEEIETDEKVNILLPINYFQLILLKTLPALNIGILLGLFITILISNVTSFMMLSLIGIITFGTWLIAHTNQYPYYILYRYLYQDTYFVDKYCSRKQSPSLALIIENGVSPEYIFNVLKKEKEALNKKRIARKNRNYKFIKKIHRLRQPTPEELEQKTDQELRKEGIIDYDCKPRSPLPPKNYNYNSW